MVNLLQGFESGHCVQMVYLKWFTFFFLCVTVPYLGPVGYVAWHVTMTMQLIAAVLLFEVLAFIENRCHRQGYRPMLNFLIYLQKFMLLKKFSLLIARIN